MAEHIDVGCQSRGRPTTDLGSWYMGTGRCTSSRVLISTRPGLSFLVRQPPRQCTPSEISGTVPSPLPLRTPESCA